MRKPNLLKAKLRRSEPVLGTWCVIPSATVANILAIAGLEYIIIDLEHGPASLETVAAMVIGAESEQCTPLVRVPGNHAESILRVLETGAHGVIIPQVEHADDARRAVEHCKYYPQGRRGLSPYTRSAGYTGSGARGLAERENAQTFVGIIVEGERGLENLDAIITIEHLDLIYLGVYDISQSLGIPGKVRDPRVRAYLTRYAERIRESGKAAGTLAQNVEEIQELHQMGFNFIAYKADCALLTDACASIMKSDRSPASVEE